MESRRLDVLEPSGAVAPRMLVVEGGRIVALEEAGDVEPGVIAVPGFVDLQINGGWGRDFTSDPHGIWEVGGRLCAHGVTAFLPTVISAADETYERALTVLRAGPPPGYTGARPLGLHAEGPFLSPDRCGAHERRHVRPPGSAPPAWVDAPELRMLTLAPEVKGALELVRRLAARGVLVACGHSNADDATARAAFDAGARYGTHVFNAMSGVHHREPGLATAVLRDDRVVAGAIVDGIHLHPATVDLVVHAKGALGLNLVSDAVAAAGMPDGGYVLGGLDVEVRDGAVRLADGTLAGSALTLDRAVRHLVESTGLDLAAAVATVTEVPARLLGGACGRLEVGGPADVTVLDAGGTVVECWVGGARMA